MWYGVGEKDGSDWDLGIFGVGVGVGGLLNLERAVLCLVAGFFLEFVRGLVSTAHWFSVWEEGTREQWARECEQPGLWDLNACTTLQASHVNRQELAPVNTYTRTPGTKTFYQKCNFFSEFLDRLALHQPGAAPSRRV